MTNDTLALLAAASLVKGLVFGALFAWLFPPVNRYVARRMSRDAGPPQQVALGSRLYWGLAMLAGSGFALVDLMGGISDAAGLPEALRWIVCVLFGLSAWGATLINVALSKPQQSSG
jgi:hypothetical protein